MDTPIRLTHPSHGATQDVVSLEVFHGVWEPAGWVLDGPAASPDAGPPSDPPSDPAPDTESDAKPAAGKNGATRSTR